MPILNMSNTLRNIRLSGIGAVAVSVA